MTLQEYIHRFSKKHNELPNIADADVINGFICGMTCKALVHMLGHEIPCMMWELLDVTTKYAIGEEVIQANFSSKAKAVGHLSHGDSSDDLALAQSRCEEEMVAAVDYATRPQSHGWGMCPEHFEKALKAPHPFHQRQAKHLLKDCATMRSYICGTLGQLGKAQKPA